jgi:predicted metal-dependent hydrolase
MELYTLRRTASTRMSLRVAADGSLRVRAPWLVPGFVIDRFVESNAGWIRAQRAQLPLAEPVLPRSVEVWGRAFDLEIVSPGRLPRVELDPQAGRLTLRVPATWGPEQRRRVLDHWEKVLVETAVAEALPRWELVTGLKADRWTVKRLRSRWGSCRPATRSLVFNARLGALPPECLDYVIVHELTHLVEPSHNVRFHALVEGWFPQAPRARALLRAFGRVGSGVSPDLPATGGGGTEPPGPR